MSKLEDLIKELCPDGVEYKELGAVLSYEQPQKYIVTNTNYNDEYATPVLTAGQTFILGYTNETNGIYKASKENPVIIFDDFTTSFHWVEFDFKVKSSAMKMLRPKDDLCCFKFLFYVMQTIKYTPVDHTRQWIEKYSKFIVPVPPIEVQREIVRILDNFTELTAGLTAELTARKQQYEFYRDKLLSFDIRNVIEYKNLELCCDILDYKRQPITKSARKKGVFPYYGANGIQDYVADYIFDGQFVLVGEDGSVLTKNGNPVVTWAEGKIWVNNHAHIIKYNGTVLLRFLFHYLQTINIKSFIHGNIPKLTGKNFRALKIPVLPLAEQERIVAILDRFDKLCNGLTQGLPAEIEARKKQYEYYRDKLLDFKQIAE